MAPVPAGRTPNNPNSRGCPFKDENGETVPHYDSMEAAEAAYHAQNGGSFGSAVTKKKSKPAAKKVAVNPPKPKKTESEKQLNEILSNRLMTEDDWSIMRYDQAVYAQFFQTSSIELPLESYKELQGLDGSTYLLQRDSDGKVTITDEAGNEAPMKGIKTVWDVYQMKEVDVHKALYGKTQTPAEAEDRLNKILANRHMTQDEWAVMAYNESAKFQFLSIAQHELPNGFTKELQGLDGSDYRVERKSDKTYIVDAAENRVRLKDVSTIQELYFLNELTVRNAFKAKAAKDAKKKAAKAAG